MQFNNLMSSGRGEKLLIWIVQYLLQYINLQNKISCDKLTVLLIYFTKCQKELIHYLGPWRIQNPLRRNGVHGIQLHNNDINEYYGGNVQ